MQVPLETPPRAKPPARPPTAALHNPRAKLQWQAFIARHCACPRVVWRLVIQSRGVSRSCPACASAGLCVGGPAGTPRAPSAQRAGSKRADLGALLRLRGR